jgi:hypothetical protein
MELSSGAYRSLGLVEPRWLEAAQRGYVAKSPCERPLPLKWLLKRIESMFQIDSITPDLSLTLAHAMEMMTLRPRALRMLGWTLPLVALAERIGMRFGEWEAQSRGFFVMASLQLRRS